ncbi:MAG: hypothetical protein WC381_08040 [Kiritimatiellia bacterium]|jgi:hypothetical protein
MKSKFALGWFSAVVVCSLGLAATGVDAQTVPVTSRNVAGYIKLTVAKRGLYQIHYPLVALEQSAVTVNDMMSHLPNGSSIIFWDAETQSFVDHAIEVKLLGVWMPGTNNLIGKTFWLQVGNSATPSFDIFLTGEVPDARTKPVATMDLNVSGPDTINLVGYPYPIEMHWTNTSFAANAANGSAVLTYDTGAGDYIYAVKAGGVWSRDIVLQPGQGLWLHSRDLATWIETKPYSYP